MDDTLVDLLPAAESSDLSDIVRRLLHEVLQLRQEVARLRRENIDLRQQANYYKAMHAKAVQRGEQLEAQLQQLRGENAQLKAEIFGPGSKSGNTRLS